MSASPRNPLPRAGAGRKVYSGTYGTSLVVVVFVGVVVGVVLTLGLVVLVGVVMFEGVVVGLVVVVSVVVLGAFST